jgi:hypothetical protein
VTTIRSADTRSTATPNLGSAAATAAQRRRIRRRRHVVRRVILQACSHPVTLGRQRELIVISARHPTMLATPAGQTRIELRLQWFIR